jgi:hypothetical protein
MLQATTTHAQFEILARSYLAQHPEVPHSWRNIYDAWGGRTDLVCWPDSDSEVFASLTEHQITVGTIEGAEDYETFGRDMTDEDLAREAMAILEALISERLAVAS